MPVTEHTRLSFLYFGTLTRLKLSLGITDPVIEWRWEGVGLTGWIVAVFEHEDTPNTPINGITERKFSETLYLFGDLKETFFPGIPDAKFVNMTATYDDTFVYFNRNLEE